MYSRFLSTCGRKFRAPKRGIFKVAYALTRYTRLNTVEEEILSEELTWFNRHLHVPKLADTRAVFWFKTEDNESIRRMWRIVTILKAYGSRVEMKMSRNPGRVIFEDDFQVAAVPYSRIYSVYGANGVAS